MRTCQHTDERESRSSARGYPGSRRPTCSSAATTSPSLRPTIDWEGTPTPTTCYPRRRCASRGHGIHRAQPEHLSRYCVSSSGNWASETRPTEMSMSIRCEGCGLEYAGAKGTTGVFAHAGSLSNPRFLRLLSQVPRFYRDARVLLDDTANDETLGDFLERGRYSEYFVSHFVVPLVSCVWSVGPGRVQEFPARYLFRFLRESWHARRVGVAHLAYGGRRLEDLRRQDR